MAWLGLELLGIVLQSGGLVFGFLAGPSERVD